MINGAGGWGWNWCWCWWCVRKNAESIEKSVSGDTRARECGKIVGGVRRTDVTSRSNEEESLSAGTPSILVDLILTANGSRIAINNTVTSLKVISNDADALTENIVVDLIIGTGNGNRRGPCSRSNIVAILRS